MHSSKTEEIRRQLRERIGSGVYPAGSRIPSEYTIAEEFSVNKKTANKAVDALVAEGLLVRGAGGAGTIVIKRSSFPKGRIAFISAAYPYQMRILTGLQRSALEYGYAVTVFFPETVDCLPLLEKLLSSRIDGIVFCSDFGSLARDCRLPCVTVDNDASMKQGVCDVVNVNNRIGGKLIMDEVIRRGHREVVIFSSGGHFTDRRNRITGVFDSMRRAGIPGPRERLFFGGHYDDEAAVDAMKCIFRTFPATTAIVCDADDAACSILRAAQKLDRHPAVTAFGNSLNGAERLAAVEQFPERLGAAACRTLVHRITNGPGTPAREFITPQVVFPEAIPVIGADRRHREPLS